LHSSEPDAGGVFAARADILGIKTFSALGMKFNTVVTSGDSTFGDE